MTKMNRLLVTASVAALAIGTTGAAQAADLLAGAAAVVPQEFVKQRTISGTVGLYGAFSWLEETSDADDFAENPWAIGGDAKVDIPFTDALSLQIDQYGEGMFLDCDDSSCTTSENYNGGFLTGAHLTFREMDRYLVGAFVGGGVVSVGTSEPLYSQWLAGVEGQMYFGNATLYGQGGFADSKNLNEPDSQELLHNAWFLRGVGRWYPMGGNAKLEGEIGWATGEQGTHSDELDVVWWGAEYEQRVWSFGDEGFVSLFGRYDGYHYDETNHSDTTMQHVFKIGLRVDLNNENPLQRERYGVAVDLPNMNRINGHSRTID